MGLFDSMKARSLGTKAYRLHLDGVQQRKKGNYEEGEAKQEEALKLYEEAYQLGYRKSAWQLAYAILTLQRGNFEKAREMMLALEKDKTLSQEDRYTLRIQYAICQWKLGYLEKAINSLKLAGQEKMTAVIYTTLGMFLVEKAAQTGEIDEALEFNQRSLEYDDEDAATLDNMGQVYCLLSEKALKEGDSEQAAAHRKTAVGYFEKAHALKEDQITTVYYLGKMYHADGRDDEARKMVNEILKIPFSAICPVSKEQMIALQKEIG